MSEKQTEETKDIEVENNSSTVESPKKRGRSRKDNKLKKALEEKEIELAEMKDKFLRLFAEFDNFKKRSVKERLELMKNAAQDTISDLLPVLDDFQRAKQSAEDENNDEQFSEGVHLVYNKLFNVLKSKGLNAMDTNGEEFNPEFHEAITKIPAPNEEMKGKIIDTVQTGYKLNDKIIRHPKVVVGE
jgi:molecular chaperone GrpE